jgi:hypothetical protein
VAGFPPKACGNDGKRLRALVGYLRVIVGYFQFTVVELPAPKPWPPNLEMRKKDLII